VTERPQSNTAFGVAVLRAAHQLHDGYPRVLDDRVILELLGPEVAKHVAENPERYSDPRVAALRVHVLLRSRYAEERLRLAVARGVQQFVVLGAGLDTFAYRQPEWASSLRIFEVDHPASQKAKIDKLSQAAIAVPENVAFVSVDFEHETLRDRLVDHDLDFSAPVFVSCLGVLVYLTMDAVTDVFRFIASLQDGSECVLTFGGWARKGDSAAASLADMAASAGEPFLSPMDADEVTALCDTTGLAQPVFPTTAEILEYLGDRRDSLRPPTRSSIASVMVARQP
jgi:methyltransferase (TIGR00027 family)